MALGPGRYNDLCTLVREQTGAHAALVIVIGGNRGSGFSVQAPPNLCGAALVALLRDMANQIEKESQ